VAVRGRRGGRASLGVGDIGPARLLTVKVAQDMALAIEASARADGVPLSHWMRMAFERALARG